jgi:hypothetical protein
VVGLTNSQSPQLVEAGSYDTDQDLEGKNQNNLFVGLHFEL